MALHLIWAPLARQDLYELIAYIAEDSPHSARLFAHGIFEAIEHLTSFPESGRIVPECGDESIREVFRKPCRIVYRIQGSPRRIEIARIWHAARGAPDLR